MNSTEPEPETDRGVSRGEFPTTSITYKLISFDTISRPLGHSTSSELQTFVNRLEKAEKRQKETVRKEMTARLSRDEAKYRVMRGQLLSQIVAAREKEATERAAAAKALQSWDFLNELIFNLMIYIYMHCSDIADFSFLEGEVRKSF